MISPDTFQHLQALPHHLLAPQWKTTQEARNKITRLVEEM